MLDHYLPDVETARAIGFELLFVEELIVSHLVRKTRVPGFVLRDVCVLRTGERGLDVEKQAMLLVSRLTSIRERSSLSALSALVGSTSLAGQSMRLSGNRHQLAPNCRIVFREA